MCITISTYGVTNLIGNYVIEFWDNQVSDHKFGTFLTMQI